MIKVPIINLIDKFILKKTSNEGAINFFFWGGWGGARPPGSATEFIGFADNA